MLFKKDAKAFSCPSHALIYTLKQQERWTVINCRPLGTMAALTGFARSQSPPPGSVSGAGAGGGGWKGRMFGDLGGGIGPGGAAFSSLTVRTCVQHDV